MTTARGPRDVRRLIRAYVQTQLPLARDHLRLDWGDATAFPPAGPEVGAMDVPTGNQVQAVIGRPMDVYPLVQVELLSSRIRRAENAMLEGEDATGYFTTYTCQTFVWIDVDIPADLDLALEREYVTDVRDDLQMALRYVLLDKPISTDPALLVLPNSYAEDFGEPQAAKGQRWTVGGRARFDVRAQERLSRTSLATVTPGTQVTPDTLPGSIDVELTVEPLHPALQ